MTTVLFDTGADEAVLFDNMAASGLDPKAIDIVVVSHMHGDHTSGLTSLLAVDSRLTVYLPQAFPTRFQEQVRAAGTEVVQVDGPLEILPGLWSTGQMGTGVVEQALVARTEEGVVVVTGCAHPGIDEMAAHAQEVGQGEIALMFGSFHLGSANRQRVQDIIARFRQLGVRQVAPCHHTGDHARRMFRQTYDHDFCDCGVGWQWPTPQEHKGKNRPRLTPVLALICFVPLALFVLGVV